MGSGDAGNRTRAASRRRSLEDSPPTSNQGKGSPSKFSPNRNKAASKKHQSSPLSQQERLRKRESAEEVQEKSQAAGEHPTATVEADKRAKEEGEGGVGEKGAEASAEVEAPAAAAAASDSDAAAAPAVTGVGSVLAAELVPETVMEGTGEGVGEPVETNQGDVLRARPAFSYAGARVFNPSRGPVLGKDELDEDEKRRLGGGLQLQPSLIPPIPPELKVPDHCGRGCCPTHGNDGPPVAVLGKRTKPDEPPLDPIATVARLRTARLLGRDHHEPPVPLPKPPFPLSRPGGPPPFPPGGSAYLPGVVRAAQASFTAQMRAAGDAAGMAVRAAVAQAAKSAAQQFARSAANNFQNFPAPSSTNAEWNAAAPPLGTPSNPF